MPENRFEALFDRLKTDKRFRARFAEHPAEELEKAGFDPTLLDLPDALDAQEMKSTLDRLLDGGVHVDPPSPDETARLTPEQLWRRFGAIRVSPELGGNAASSVAVAVAVVVYGSAVAVSTAVLVAAGPEITARQRAFDQIKALRDLQRVGAAQLTFTVTGPDGATVDGVDIDTIKAFIGRMG